MEENKPKSPQSDFSKIMQQQWKEEQLLSEIENLKDTLRGKDNKIIELEKLLKEREDLILKIRDQLANSQKSFLQKIKDLEQKSNENENLCTTLKKENNVLRAALEEEQNKGILQKIFKAKK